MTPVRASPVALVLGGGPDAERPVSLKSSRAVADAIAKDGFFDVRLEIIDAQSTLADLPGDVIVPVLHGAWGEGGPLQDLLVRDGRPFVGCGPSAARLCMDKFATKLAAARAGVPTPPAAIVNLSDAGTPLGAPAVVKPVHEGSSVGLRICRTQDQLSAALAQLRALEKAPITLIERLIPGRELTCGLLDRGEGLVALPLVEIAPAEGVYDYAAKYDRGDTRYIVSPDLPPGVAEAIQTDALTLARAVGIRHLARIDFMLDAEGRHWLLEANTMPGFTGHSLLPKAASALGIGLPELTAGLCRLAMAHESSQTGRTADG